MGRKLFRGFAYILLTGVLTGCCFIDFSDDVRELGDLYKTKILAFYDQHGRYPAYDEDEQLIVELGCELKSRLHGSYICNWNEYEILASFGDSTNEQAYIKIIRSSTICQYWFHKGKDGEFTINKTKCWDLPCIQIGH